MCKMVESLKIKILCIMVDNEEQKKNVDYKSNPK